MDTSKEYIEMCRKAEEIQEAWYPSVGDWTDKGLFTGMYHMLNASTSASKNDLGFEIVEPKYGRFYCYRKELIWLPRQDQLQDMVKDSDLTILSYSLWQFSLYHNIDKIFKSMEQLWLAFVMHEKYRKKLDGKEWVNHMKIKKEGQDEHRGCS